MMITWKPKGWRTESFQSAEDLEAWKLAHLEKVWKPPKLGPVKFLICILYTKPINTSSSLSSVRCIGLAIYAIKLTEPDRSAVDTRVYMQVVKSACRITRALEWRVEEEVSLKDWAIHLQALMWSDREVWNGHWIVRYPAGVCHQTAILIMKRNPHSFPTMKSSKLIVLWEEKRFVPSNTIEVSSVLLFQCYTKTKDQMCVCLWAKKEQMIP